MKNAIGIALALTIVGGVVIATQGPETQTANGANAYATTLDRCPFYPSPVVCHNDPAGRTAVGSLTTSHAAAGGEKS